MKKLPVHSARGAPEDRVRRVGDDLGRAAVLRGLLAAEQVQRGGRDHGARPERVHGDPAVACSSSAMPSTHMLMPYFAIV